MFTEDRLHGTRRLERLSLGLDFQRTHLGTIFGLCCADILKKSHNLDIIDYKEVLLDK